MRRQQKSGTLSKQQQQQVLQKQQCQLQGDADDHSAAQPQQRQRDARQLALGRQLVRRLPEQESPQGQSKRHQLLRERLEQASPREELRCQESLKEALAPTARGPRKLQEKVGWVHNRIKIACAQTLLTARQKQAQCWFEQSECDLAQLILGIANVLTEAS